MSDETEEEEEEIETHLRRNNSSNIRINPNNTVLAWRLVERILDTHHAILEKTNTSTIVVEPMGVMEMADIAERFFHTYQEFCSLGKPTVVDIGFHYTKSENIPNILRFGLLSQKERQTRRVDAKFTGANAGDGIYVASDPYSFHGSFGPVGILVARLCGRSTTKMAKSSTSANNTSSFCDSVVVREGERREFHVLAESRQCIPLFRFPTHSIAPQLLLSHQGNWVLHRYTLETQKVLDAFFAAGDDDDDQLRVGSVLFDSFVI